VKSRMRDFITLLFQLVTLTVYLSILRYLILCYSRCFYGFLTEEESRNLLETEGQWLLRMDKQGFIITEATGINEDGTTSVTNYRLTYECGNFYLGSTVFAKLSHITELFPMELAHCSSPYFAICHGGHPSYYAHGDSSDRGYVWGKLISCIK
jgi:hypothetical protein